MFNLYFMRLQFIELGTQLMVADKETTNASFESFKEEWQENEA